MLHGCVIGSFSLVRFVARFFFFRFVNEIALISFIIGYYYMENTDLFNKKILSLTCKIYF